jgi:hypothetical protein
MHMRNKQKFIFGATTYCCLALLVFLTGCIAGAELTLRDRDSGTIATGTADRWTHTVTINLDDKVYKGTFAYVDRASPFAGVAAEGAALSDGNMIAKADDGSSLYCDFSFSGWSASGTGKCQDDDKNEYDLQLKGHY